MAFFTSIRNIVVGGFMPDRMIESPSEAMSQVIDILHKAFADSHVVLKVVVAISAVAFSFMFPTEATIWFAISTGACIAADTLSGLLAARFNKEPITSIGSRRVFYKIMGYSMLILVARIVGQAVPMAIPTTTQASAIVIASSVVCWMMGFIILTEAISILENVRRMGVHVPYVFKKRIQDTLDKYDNDGGSKDGNSNDK